MNALGFCLYPQMIKLLNTNQADKPIFFTHEQILSTTFVLYLCVCM